MIRRHLPKPSFGAPLNRADRFGRRPVRVSTAALAALAALALSAPLAAQVIVSDPWARGVVAGQKTTGAYFTLMSATDATLVAVSSPAAKIVEIHEMRLDGGVMKMSAVEKLPLPAGRNVNLTPGGYHVMLMDLRAPLKDGDIVPLTLTIVDKAGRTQKVDVKAKVRPLTAPAAPPK
jgi:periplasmic copper chaperone A